MYLNYFRVGTVPVEVFAGVALSISTIVGGLHWADGHKGHEVHHAKPEDLTG